MQGKKNNFFFVKMSAQDMKSIAQLKKFITNRKISSDKKTWVEVNL